MPILPQNSNPWIFINPPTQQFIFDPNEPDIITSAPTEQSFKDGCTCKKCGEHYPYAVPNQNDGITLICWACKHGF